MRRINFSADRLVNALLNISRREIVCLLDSCGVSHLASHLLIAGIEPREIVEPDSENPAETLAVLDEKLAADHFAFFTIAYDFGLKLEDIKPRPKEFSGFPEPDVFLALFDCLIVHDYADGESFIIGDAAKFDRIQAKLEKFAAAEIPGSSEKSAIVSNFSRAEYIKAVEKAKEFIRRGDTYQINLTRQIRARIPKTLAPQRIFLNLRENHPAPFAAFFKRPNDFVVSASPERFFRVESRESGVESGEDFHSRLPTPDSRLISTSPIKGTRPRGETAAEDERLKNELLNSAKDRAENTMIVDLLRNDIGKICEFDSVRVEKLCDLETHPTLFHLVSTINGNLRAGVKFADIIRAVFPCGSITGAPKIRTMRIIDELETANRGLSMGAIGFKTENGKRKTENTNSKFFRFPFSVFRLIDSSVAIRTMVIKNHEAIFNVGGGIVFDSVPADEYAETETKARALLHALRAED